ncbi:hypothetical protein ACIQTW_21585 [Paenarthrobacter sp. NPDC090517]|uniref:hypothetical protein n=1 Tax=Paenarthrobacter sp. NPDC090517 TaxID=3364381 RepID=UPI003827738F
MTDQTWFVDLDLKLESPISDALLDDLIDVVIPLHGAVSSGDEPKLGLSLAFEALDAWHASSLARNFLELDLGPIMPNVEIASVRILDEETRTAENEEPTFPPMMAIPDIGDLLGVTRQQAHRLTKREDFPTPALEPRTGPLWIRAAVESWNEHTERQAGRPATKKMAAAEEAPGEGEWNISVTSVKKAPSSSQRTVKNPTDSHRIVKDPSDSTRRTSTLGSEHRTIRG